MKKVIFAVILFFSFTNTASAFLLAPYLDFYITVTNSPPDGNFNFQATGSYPNVFSKNFTVQTTNGNGSYFFEANTSSNGFFSLDWAPTAGWNLDAIICTSSNPQILLTTSATGVGIVSYPYSSVYCTFNFNQQVKKTPLLLIPGTLGTEIFKGTEKLWPDVDRMTSISHPSDSFMDPLAFKNDATPLDTSLSLGSVLGRVVSDFDYTKQLTDNLKSSGYTDQDISLFPYDWRDDISKNADVNLKSQIDALYSANNNNKIDIIAHSQGGLLIKKLLFDYPDYTNKINKLIFVGTPNLGAPKSLKILLYGDSLGVEKWKIGLDPQEIKKIAQNMPAIYQMLPSQSYFDHNADGYMGEIYHGFKNNFENFSDTKTALKKDIYGLNTSLIDSADTFHPTAYDNMDFTGSSMDVYNLVGCESPTVGHIIGNSGGDELDLDYVPGDGTVPVVSASNIPGAKTFLILDSAEIHGTMLTRDIPRQKILNILNNNNSSVTGITTNPALCEFDGEKVSIHSPVDLDIYDENGNHVGLSPDGSLESQIDGVSFDVLGHEKFAFLPKGHTYKLKLKATGDGTFDFFSSTIVGGDKTSTTFYSKIPITSTSTAEVILNDQNNQTINFTSDNRVVPPSAILDANQSEDQIPPTTTSTLSGTLGQPGYYRSNVDINLTATDPIIPGQENQTSGVLNTSYSMDNAPYTTYIGPINITLEGSHTLKFFSTDKAGNNEQEQTISFTVDKTAPEINGSFNPSLKDFVFSSADNASSTPQLSCTNTQCAATDTAGNTTLLKFEKATLPLNTKTLLLKNISYNNQPATNFDPNVLSATYATSGGVNYLLSQTELIKNKQLLNILYAPKQNQSTVTDWTKSSKPTVTNYAGTKTLQIQTNQGKIQTGMK